MNIHSEYLALKKSENYERYCSHSMGFQIMSNFFFCQEHFPQPSHMVYVIFV